MLERTTGQLIARNSIGKSEIVLDTRGCPSLATGRLALDDDRVQSLGRGTASANAFQYTKIMNFASLKPSAVLV